VGGVYRGPPGDAKGDAGEKESGASAQKPQTKAGPPGLKDPKRRGKGKTGYAFILTGAHRSGRAKARGAIKMKRTLRRTGGGQRITKKKDRKKGIEMDLA